MKLLYEDVPPLEFLEEMSALWDEHYEELCVHKEFELDPDLDVYRVMADKGMLRVVTVRADDALVGYMVFIVKPHLHYKSTLIAIEDLYFLKKEYRQGRIGIRMFKYAEEALARLGVQLIVIRTKVHLDNSRLLEYLDYKFTEKVYMKRVVPQ